MNAKREGRTRTITRAQALAATEFLKRFVHPNRLLIACALIEGERSVSDLEALLGIRQPALSQQLAELRRAGIVDSRREVKQVFYRVSDPRTLALLEFLQARFWSGSKSSSAAKLEEIKIPASPHVVLALSPGRTSEAARFARVELRETSSDSRR